MHADNHHSNLEAWREKGRRFGFTVVTVDQMTPHPGMDYSVDAYARAMTQRTRVITFTHLSNIAGDLMPAKELCRLAREHGALSLVDGAQSFGLLDVDLADMQPDFYSGSAHKWPCGARECGVLFVRQCAQERLWPLIYSAYPGAVGFSRTFEGFGQRDGAMIAFREALAFQAPWVAPPSSSAHARSPASCSKALANCPASRYGRHLIPPCDTRSPRSRLPRSPPARSPARSTRTIASPSPPAADGIGRVSAHRRTSTTAPPRSTACSLHWRNT